MMGAAQTNVATDFDPTDDGRRNFDTVEMI